MSVVFRGILILVCFSLFFYTLRKIKKEQIQIEDTLFWIIISFILLIISLFPRIADYFANKIGIYSTVNFCFLSMIFILLLQVFLLSIKLSKLENTIKSLIQELSIKDNNNGKK